MRKSISRHPVKKDSSPYFSILIPSYNRPEYLKQCVESIIQSDFEDYEIIISDDNSPRAEEIRNVLRPFLKYKNISFFEQNNNLKEPNNKNYLVDHAMGKYNIFIGDDDKLYPSALQTIKRYITMHPENDLYAFGYTMIDENDQFYYSRTSPKAIEVSLENKTYVRHLFESTIFPFWLYHPATFCCKNGIEKKIRYSNSAGIGEDILFLFDLINLKKRIYVIPESMFLWRKIQNQKSEGQMNQSLEDLSNILARKSILYHLRSRRDLAPEISDIVSDYKYCQTFLFNAMIQENVADKAMIDKLNLNSVDRKAFEEYYHNSNQFYSRLCLYFQRVREFIQLFGVKGIYAILNVLVQRLKYQLTR